MEKSKPDYNGFLLALARSQGNLRQGNDKVGRMGRKKIIPMVL